MHRKTLAATFFSLGLILTAGSAAAQTTAPSLVSCSSPAGIGDTSCTLCAMVSTAQNLINFAIIIAFPVAAILFGWAGFLYMTSAANPGGIARAHGIFRTVAIGFAFVLLGWVIVDTIIHEVVLRYDTNAFAAEGGSWYRLPECTGARATNKAVSDLLTGLFAPSNPNNTPITSTFSTQTPDAATAVADNSPGAGLPPITQQNIDPNIQSGVNMLDRNAQAVSQGKCAYYVRQALAAEGYTDLNTNHPVAAADYGSYLADDGFASVAQNFSGNYVPQTGDVAVFQAIANHPYGHIEMYDGAQWVSDFKQNGFYPASAYASGGAYTIYRPSRQPST